MKYTEIYYAVRMCRSKGGEICGKKEKERILVLEAEYEKKREKLTIATRSARKIMDTRVKAPEEREQAIFGFIAVHCWGKPYNLLCVVSRSRSNKEHRTALKATVPYPKCGKKRKVLCTFVLSDVLGHVGDVLCC